jgi:hypothetical protein
MHDKKYYNHFKFFFFVVLITSPIIAKGDYSKQTAREVRTKSNASLFRMGGSGFGLVRFQNETTGTYHSNAIALFADFYFYRIRSSSGNGLDLYSRGTFRSFNEIDMKMIGGDIGIRGIYGFYFLRELWQVYILAAPRFLYTSAPSLGSDETVYEEKGSFYSIGIVGGAGIEMTLLPRFGLFLEYNYGYVPVGKSKTNSEEHHFYAGITFRSEVR